MARAASSSANGPALLVLRGPARLEFGGREVKLRRKGLALLYYLAIEGPTRREVLADLLWGHETASRNLRVELHRLRKSLEEIGSFAFRSGEDILALPAGIEIEEGRPTGEVLEGLDDLSEGLQMWLEGQRAGMAQGSSGAEARTALARKVAQNLRPPFLLLLKGKTGWEGPGFAKLLANNLGLPFFEGLRGTSRAVFYLSLPYPQDAARHVIKNPDNIWVVECPPYGEDPHLVLELRSTWSPEHTRYLTLPPLRWSEARNGLLQKLPFDEAARYFLASEGNPTYLEEMLRERAHRDPERSGQNPFSQRVKSAIQLEHRFLSLEGRLALEALSVHPGTLSEGLLKRFGATRHLDEIERRGHLIYEEGWHFAHDSARTIIYASLQPGRRQRYHRMAAAQFAEEGELVAEAFHRQRARDPVDWDAVGRQDLPAWARDTLAHVLGRERQAPVPYAEEIGIGRELALVQKRTFGTPPEAEGDTLLWARTPSNVGPSGIEWELPDEPCVLSFKGRAMLQNPLGIGTSGDAVPLSLTLLGPKTRVVHFADVGQPHRLGSDEIVLPTGESFEAHIDASGHHTASLESRLSHGVIELGYGVFATETASMARTRRSVRVYRFKSEAVETA